ncbi:hypothetical protein [Kingella kingae]|nr:hypothetical protein [Kingella kingae]MDK4536440.1 hypothetical protein [Kingella kingae]MDK4539759.1 hypothetical protein [Kingella kingae]
MNQQKVQAAFIVNSLQTSTALPMPLCTTRTRRTLSPCPRS